MLDKNLLDPPIRLSGKCHTCLEPILFWQECCPHCGITLDHEEMIPSVVDHFWLTQAISSANSIRTFDVGVYLFMGTMIIRFLSDYPVWLNVAFSLFWVVPLITIARWFRIHGKWNTKDGEYQASRKEMTTSFCLWLIANVINGFVIAWIA